MNINGDVSFDKKFGSYVLKLFLLSENDKLIVIFWIDIDIIKIGNVYYWIFLDDNIL